MVHRLYVIAVVLALGAFAHLYGISPPAPSVLSDRVSVIEVNHFFDEQGRLVFDQAIFYDWNGDRYQVRAWRLIKSEGQLPQRDWQRGGYVSLWTDSVNGKEAVREVRSESARETWSQVDYELLEREVLPSAARRELSKPGRR